MISSVLVKSCVLRFYSVSLAICYLLVNELISELLIIRKLKLLYKCELEHKRELEVLVRGFVSLCCVIIMFFVTV